MTDITSTRLDFDSRSPGQNALGMSLRTQGLNELQPANRRSSSSSGVYSPQSPRPTSRPASLLRQASGSQHRSLSRPASSVRNSIEPPRRNTGGGFIIGPRSNSPGPSWHQSMAGSSQMSLHNTSTGAGNPGQWQNPRSSIVSDSGRPLPDYGTQRYEYSDPETTTRGRQPTRRVAPGTRTESDRRWAPPPSEDLRVLLPWSQRPDELEAYREQTPRSRFLLVVLLRLGFADAACRKARV